MSSKIGFSEFLPLSESNEEYLNTEKQYLKSIGREMPKYTYYLKHFSDLSKMSQEYG